MKVRGAIVASSILESFICNHKSVFSKKHLSEFRSVASLCNYNRQCKSSKNYEIKREALSISSFQPILNVLLQPWALSLETLGIRFHPSHYYLQSAAEENQFIYVITNTRGMFYYYVIIPRIWTTRNIKDRKWQNFSRAVYAYGQPFTAGRKTLVELVNAIE